MHEYILAAVLPGNEAVAFTIVEPFYCSCDQWKYLCLVELECASLILKATCGSNYLKNWRDFRTDYKTRTATVRSIAEVNTESKDRCY
jgi:hypothetical protein